MAEKIPGEIISPSIKNGVLCWCRGDVFTFNLTLALSSLGEEYLLSENDTVEVSFYDKSDFCVHKFSTVAENGSCITLVFDEVVSSAFDKGRYTYDICITTADGMRVTVANDNTAVVS